MKPFNVGEKRLCKKNGEKKIIPEGFDDRRVMMKRRLFTCFLIAVMLVVPMVRMMPAFAQEGGEASPWAKAEIEEVIQLGFIPEDMQREYQKPMTRAEFAKISVLFVAHHFGMSVEEVVEWYLSAHVHDGHPITFKEDSFTDIENSPHAYYIRCANTMHIVYGRGDGIFDPEGFITREEAATMLLRVYFSYGGGVKLGPKSEGVDRFYDVEEISSWANTAVRYMYQWDVMKGVSDASFAPKETYTREQSYLTFLRLDKVYAYR